MRIYLDFDGTVVEHTYPKMGRCNFGCMEVIKKLQDAGHEIILNTYRADCADGTLEQAIDYLKSAYRVTKPRNDDFDLLPFEHTKAKIHAPEWDIDRAMIEDILFIDDQSRGTPLKDAVMSNGKMVKIVIATWIFYMIINRKFTGQNTVHTGRGRFKIAQIMSFIKPFKKVSMAIIIPIKIQKIFFTNVRGCILFFHPTTSN